MQAPARVSENLTNDAHLAAPALEHQADVVSFDRDFTRFARAHHQVSGYRTIALR
jgi:predicted nucleic acid-binding protein